MGVKVTHFLGASTGQRKRGFSKAEMIPKKTIADLAASFKPPRTAGIYSVDW